MASNNFYLPTRQQFADEERRIKALQRQGRPPDYIKGWLRGWRLVGSRLQHKSN